MGIGLSCWGRGVKSTPHFIGKGSRHFGSVSFSRNNFPKLAHEGIFAGKFKEAP